MTNFTTTIRNVFEHADESEPHIIRAKIENLFCEMGDPRGFDMKQAEICRMIFLAGCRSGMDSAQEAIDKAFAKRNADGKN